MTAKIPCTLWTKMDRDNWSIKYINKPVSEVNMAVKIWWKCTIWFDLCVHGKMILTLHTLEHAKEINKNVWQHEQTGIFMASRWICVFFFFIICKDHQSSYFVFFFFSLTSENAIWLFPNNSDLFPSAGIFCGLVAGDWYVGNWVGHNVLFLLSSVLSLLFFFSFFFFKVSMNLTIWQWSKTEQVQICALRGYPNRPKQNH